MHSQIIFGSSFHGCLDYVLGKPGASMIATHNLVGTKVAQFTKQFQGIANRSTRIKKPVMHVDFSPHPDECGQFNRERIMEFAEHFFQRLGMENCQWVLVQHNDTVTPAQQPRPHFHAVANRIPVDQNKAVNSSWIGRRCQQILRDLRPQFGLTALRKPEQIERKPISVGQHRRFRREQEEYEQGLRLEPPEKPVKVQLQDAIDQWSQEKPTLAELTQNLRQQGIEVRVSERGISYSLDGVAFSGTQLGRAYTINGLAKYRGVKPAVSTQESRKSVEPEASASSPVDLETSDFHVAGGIISESSPISPQITEIVQSDLTTQSSWEYQPVPSQVTKTSVNHVAGETIEEQSPAPPQVNETVQNNPTAQSPSGYQSVSPQENQDNTKQLQQQWALTIAPVIMELLDYYQSNELENGRYTINRFREDNRIVVDRTDELFTILGVDLKPDAPLVWTNELQKRDLDHFLAIKQELEQLQSIVTTQSEPTVTTPESTVNTPSPQFYQQLENDYAIPTALSTALFEIGKLDVDNQGEAVFVKQPIVGQVTENPAFWIATGEKVEKAIVTDSPVEAISAFLIDYYATQPYVPTVYLSIEQTPELPMELMEQLDYVVVGVKDEALASQLKSTLPDAQHQSDGQLFWNQLWLQQLQRQQLEQLEKEDLEKENLEKSFAKTQQKSHSSSRQKQNQIEL